MNGEIVFSLLQPHVPPSSLEYCCRLWQQQPFDLKLTKSRQSKVGDFTSRRNEDRPRITLNEDLNPYLFLITYIHEVAHLHVFQRFRNKVEAHGKEWKQTFRELMIPVLQESVFPPEILREISRHIQHPKASSFADSKLTAVLRSFDPAHKQLPPLSEVPEGSIFKLNGRYFKKGKVRRTRILCSEVKTKRQYLVPADALVTDVQLSLL